MDRNIFKAAMSFIAIALLFWIPLGFGILMDKGYLHLDATTARHTFEWLVFACFFPFAYLTADDFERQAEIRFLERYNSIKPAASFPKPQPRRLQKK